MWNKYIFIITIFLDYIFVEESSYDMHYKLGEQSRRENEGVATNQTIVGNNGE